MRKKGLLTIDNGNSLRLDHNPQFALNQIFICLLFSKEFIHKKFHKNEMDCEIIHLMAGFNRKMKDEKFYFMFMWSTAIM